MATYRVLQMSFWTDSKIADEFSPEDKYFYLYLLTNPKTNLAGCYEISIRQISIDTGYTREIVERLIDRLEKQHNVIRYCKETKELLILNWHKYNWTRSDKYAKGLEKFIGNVKNPEFKRYLEDIANGIDTVCIPYTNPMDTSITIPITIPIPINEQKVDQEDLSEENFKKLWELYPKKKGKGSVSKSTKKELLKIGYEVMAECIELYKKDIVGVEEKYICFGSTFFNSRYKDYLEAAEKSIKAKVSEPKKEEPEDEELTDEEFDRLVDSGAYDY